jgi:hypothetical protein
VWAPSAAQLDQVVDGGLDRIHRGGQRMGCRLGGRGLRDLLEEMFVAPR